MGSDRAFGPQPRTAGKRAGDLQVCTQPTCRRMRLTVRTGGSCAETRWKPGGGNRKGAGATITISKAQGQSAGRERAVSTQPLPPS